MKFKNLLGLIKIEHTLFALPLALTGAVLGARGTPDGRILVLVGIAFTAARAAAMAFNRLADRRLDAANPRTARREIPAGRVSATAAALVVAAATGVFLWASWAINPFCGRLAPLALGVVLGYSYTKRFTVLCHYVLGVALGMAPVAGWAAVTDGIAWPPVVLGTGVVFWTAGFDTIYAIQDIAFDRDMDLRSLPARIGPIPAMRLAAGSHLVAFLLFLLSGVLSSLGWPFYALLPVTGGLLVWEHRLIRPGDLSRLDTAFFTANSLVSGSLLVAVCAGIFV